MDAGLGETGDAQPGGESRLCGLIVGEGEKENQGGKTC
jgi:hypothetical protein